MIFRKKKKTSEQMLCQLRQGGAKIGEDVVVYSPSSTVIDNTAPWLLTIGEHVRITAGVVILTHDYAWSALKRYSSEEIRPGQILGAQSPVTIGSNVFIGMNAIITRGVTIADHVIIGAGSVVTKDCPCSGVYAGNPAKRIMSMEEYYEKRKRAQFDEARIMALQYRDRMGKLPPKEIFSEYFMLFARPKEAKEVPAFQRQMKLLGNYEQTLAYMDGQAPMFEGYEAFLQACFAASREEEK